MAILGTLIDRTTVSRAVDAGTTVQNVGVTSLAHSLPATNPEAVFINVRSVEAINSTRAVFVRPFGMGGNASLTTFGYEFSPGLTGASCGVVLFDVIAVVFHSIIR
jgi:hypothetical protein